ncbi:hypothetical protein K490DRAFT_57094 [Saccharata proteae CBS 121410]|uniref:Uncharacterized protein n=1 Tax=Saccharata proteae CBS 121410 TaxID=1314787 RepID=A0A9P4HW14_9PEZI|nr:hypothetical protein K490DRAFT_57094 [Saccharata proteae CBS 121410]
MKFSNAESGSPLSPPYHAPRDSELTSNDRISAFVPLARNMRAHPEPSSIIDDGDRPANAPRDPASLANNHKAVSGLVDDDEEYEVLQGSGILPSEDEAETVSSFSLEGPMADDVRSVTSNSNESEQSADEEEPEPVFEPSDSGMTARPSIETIHSSMTSEHLARDTGLDNDSDLPDVDHVQRLDRMHFDEWAREESNEVWDLRFSTSGKVLIWVGTFRILFFGRFNEAYKEVIISAIARALQVGQDTPGGSVSRPSRLSVVPVSAFGGNGPPEVELIPTTGFDFVHEHCNGIMLQKDTDPPSIALRLQSKRGRSVNAEDDGKHLRRFDLAVAGVSSSSLLSSFRDAMDAQQTPVLTVALPLQEILQSQTIDLFGDEKSMRVEVKNESLSVTGVRPVPLNVLNSLDSRLLNQHLACIGVEDKSKTLERDSNVGAPTRKGSMRQRVRNFGARLRNDRAFCKRVILQTLLSLLLISLGVFHVASFFNSCNDMASRHEALTSEIARFVNVSKPAITKDPSLIPRTDRGYSVGFPGENVPNFSAARTTDKPVGDSVGQLAPRFNNSDEFKVHIVGDHHFILTPPGKLRKFDVQVLRGSSPVPSEDERLVDGVYAVKLDRKDAHGVLNVTVWTVSTKKKTEPSLLQHLTIDFGSDPWYTIDGLNELASTALNKARTDLMVMQSGVANKSMQLYSGLQRASGNAHVSGSKVVQQTFQLVNGTVTAAHMRADSLLQAWKGTTSLQISAEPVQKAHKNAAGLMGKMRARYEALWGDKTEDLMAECKENRGRGLACGKLNAKSLKEFHREKKKSGGDRKTGKP